jgi:hypothetical protein
MVQDLEQPRKFAARQLKYGHPRVRKKCRAHNKQYIEKKQLRERSRQIATDAKELGLTQKQSQ